MTDIFPVLEVSVAALTFVLGFVSARHHAYLSSARELVHRLGSELEADHGDASRDRARELLMLARKGLATDWVVVGTLVAAWVWVALNTWLAAWAVTTISLGDAAPQKAMGAILISLVVVGLGTWDGVAVNGQLGNLRERTTVGLLSSAAQAADRGHFHDVIPLATLAASRNPALAWPFAFRAQAYVGLAAESKGGGQAADLRDAALRDMRRLIERRPSAFAGLLDWFGDSDQLDLDEGIVDLLLPHLTSVEGRLHAARRLRSHVDGSLRRAIIGRKGDEDELPKPHGLAEQALVHWRYGRTNEGRRVAEQIYAERDRRTLRTVESVVAAGILQLVGREDQGRELLEPLLVQVAGPSPDEEKLLRIAAVFGMQLRMAEDGIGHFAAAARKWDAAAVALELDEAILTLARRVFVPPRLIAAQDDMAAKAADSSSRTARSSRTSNLGGSSAADSTSRIDR